MFELHHTIDVLFVRSILKIAVGLQLHIKHIALIDSYSLVVHW